MATVICIANNKGGVGKSTLSINLAGTLSEFGKKVLLIDMDAQANLTSVFSHNQKSTLTVADLIYNDADINQIIQKKFNNLSIVPASSELKDMDATLAGDDDAQFLLADDLKEIDGRFDFVLIDCPPNLGKATRMALVASDYFIIPIMCQDWAVKGCKEIIAYAKRVQRRVNPKLKLLGVVINRYNCRRAVEQVYLEVLQKSFGNQMFKTLFPDNVPYIEALTSKLPIHLYKPKSHQAEAYRQFTKEVIDRVQEKI